MRTGKLVILLTLSALLLSARNDSGAISGTMADAEASVRIVATSLNTSETFSSVADSAGVFTLASLAPGAYRIIIRNETGSDPRAAIHPALPEFAFGRDTAAER